MTESRKIRPPVQFFSGSSDPDTVQPVSLSHFGTQETFDPKESVPQELVTLKKEESVSVPTLLSESNPQSLSLPPISPGKIEPPAKI